MPAISVRIGTIYDCNLSYDRDQIYLQSGFKKGLNMPAMIKIFKVAFKSKTINLKVH